MRWLGNKLRLRVTVSRRVNCARGLILWIYVWQWLKREKKCRPYPASCLLRQFLKAMYLDEPTLPSFSIEEQPGQCHIRCFFENTMVLICQTRFWSREPPLVSHTTAAFCSLTFREHQRKKTLDVSLHPLGSYLLAHVSLSIGLPTRQKLTQQSKQFARICRRIEASYVLLSFVYRRDFRKAT